VRQCEASSSRVPDPDLRVPARPGPCPWRGAPGDKARTGPTLARRTPSALWAPPQGTRKPGHLRARRRVTSRSRRNRRMLGLLSVKVHTEPFAATAGDLA
jgi:hypothetical protein